MERASLTIDMQLQFKNNKTGLHWLTLVNAIQIIIAYEDVFTADGSCLLVVFLFFQEVPTALSYLFAGLGFTFCPSN